MTDLGLLWMIQLAPLAAFVLIQLLPPRGRRAAPAAAMAFSLLAAVSSVLLFLRHADGAGLPRQYVH